MNFEEEKIDIDAYVAQMAEDSKLYVHPSRQEEWLADVRKTAGGLYGADTSRNAFAIMRAMEDGCGINKAIEMLDGMQLSNGGRGQVRRMIYHYSNFGPEFFRETLPEGAEIPEDMMADFMAKKEANKKLLIETVNMRKAALGKDDKVQ